MILRKNIKFLKFDNTNIAVIAYTFATICQKAVPYLLLPILTRYLSKEDYGLYSVFNSWLLVLSVFATLNLHMGGFNNGLNKHKEQRELYCFSIIMLVVVNTIIVSAIFILFSFQSEWLNLDKKYILLIFFSIMCGESTNCVLASYRFEYKIKSIAAMSSIMFLLGFFLPLIAILFRANVCWIILSNQIPTIVVGIAFFIHCGIKVNYRIEKKFCAEAFKFNFPLLPHYISGMLLSQIDRIMIDQMCGSEKVALYSVAYNISSILNLFVSSINSAILPRIYNGLNKNNMSDVHTILMKYIKFFLTSVILLILIIPEGVAIITTKEYLGAIYCIPPIVASSFFIFVYTIFSNIEFYFETKYFISFSSVIAAFLNVFLNRLLIPKLGYEIAGYTTVMCYCVYAYMHMFSAYHLEKKYQIGKIISIKEIVYCTVLLFVVIPIAIFLYSNLFPRYLVAIFIVVFFLNVIRRGDQL